MAPEAVRLEARALPDVKHRGPAHADLPREAPRRPGRERRARLAVWILCEFNPTGSNNGGDCSRLRSPPYEERADVGIPLPWILAWKACGEWVRGGSVGTRFGTRFSFLLPCGNDLRERPGFVHHREARPLVGVLIRSEQRLHIHPAASRRNRYYLRIGNPSDMQEEPWRSTRE